MENPRLIPRNRLGIVVDGFSSLKLRNGAVRIAIKVSQQKLIGNVSDFASESELEQLVSSTWAKCNQPISETFFIITQQFLMHNKGK